MTKLLVWLSRRILRVLMWVGHVISCFMERRMEYDADSFEARFAGSDTFESTTLRLPMVRAAYQMTMNDLTNSFEDGKLADDLLALVRYRQKHLPAEIVAHISIMSLKSKTGWLDAHPADHDRIAAVKRLAAPGVFRIDAPVQVLFKHYEQLCRLASAHLYQQQLGARFEDVERIPTRRLIRMRHADEAASSAGHRFFHGMADVNSPIWPPSDSAQSPLETEQAVKLLRRARQQILKGKKRAAALSTRLEEADDRVLQLNAAQQLVAAGLNLSLADWCLSACDPDTLRQAANEAAGNLTRLKKQHRELVAPAQQRLACVLALLETGDLPQLAKRETKLKRAGKFVAALNALRGIFRLLSELNRNADAAASLLQNISCNEENQQLSRRIETAMQDITRSLVQLKQMLGSIDYPFDHADGRMSIGQFACEQIPNTNDIGEVMGSAEQAVQRLYGLYHRCMSWLALIGQDVESSLGLKPLPEPTED